MNVFEHHDHGLKLVDEEMEDVAGRISQLPETPSENPNFIQTAQYFGGKSLIAPSSKLPVLQSNSSANFGSL